MFSQCVFFARFLSCIIESKIVICWVWPGETIKLRSIQAKQCKTQRRRFYFISKQNKFCSQSKNTLSIACNFFQSHTVWIFKCVFVWYRSNRKNNNHKKNNQIQNHIQSTYSESLRNKNGTAKRVRISARMIIFLKVAHTLFERHLFMHGNTSNQNQATTETGTILFMPFFAHIQQM